MGTLVGILVGAFVVAPKQILLHHHAVQDSPWLLRRRLLCPPANVHPWPTLLHAHCEVEPELHEARRLPT